MAMPGSSCREVAWAKSDIASRRKRIWHEIKALQIMSKKKNNGNNNIVDLLGISISKSIRGKALYLNLLYCDAGLDLRKWRKYHNLKKFDTKFLKLDYFAQIPLDFF